MTSRSHSTRRPGLWPTGPAAALLVLAACAPMPAPEPTPPPPPAPPPVAAPPAISEASAAVRRHFARQEATLRSRGLMRTDGGGRDAPFSLATLVENFERIALFDEYVEIDGRFQAREVPSRLRRWEVPVRLAVTFGPSVPAAQRARDLRDLRALVARLARVTGHPVGLTADPAAANFHLFVLSEDERRGFGPELATRVPGIDGVSLATVTDLPLSVSCIVLAFARGGTSVYSQAVAVVRAELPDLTRLSCYHEELAQGLGLPNDSDTARPTVFNDSQEFALLTDHDDLLLRILYDPRLRPGMTPTEARPIVAAIARDLLAGES